jgi:hypothetical protein
MAALESGGAASLCVSKGRFGPFATVEVTRTNYGFVRVPVVHANGRE